MQMLRLKTLIDQLGSGPHLVDQLGSKVQVSASFQIFLLRMLRHSDIHINVCILHVRTSVRP